MIKKIVIITIVTLMLMGCFSLPLFAQITPPSEQVGHYVNVFAPVVSVQNGTGDQTGNETITQVDYEQIADFSPANDEEQQDMRYIVTIVTQVYATLDKGYRADTHVIYTYGEGDESQNVQGVTYTTTKPYSTVKQYSFAPNRQPFELELVVDAEQNADGTIYSEYRTSLTLGLFEGGKTSITNIYLWCDAVFLARQNDVMTDVEIIERVDDDAGNYFDHGVESLWDGAFGDYGEIPINVLLQRGASLIGYAWDYTPNWVTGIIVAGVAVGLTVKAVMMLV